jgi:PIN domain nuclease of toxin-antitoxin system
VRILLDTHAFLWFFAGDERLSDAARAAIESQSNQNFLSVGSLWEVAIKTSLGKLSLSRPFEDVVQQAIVDVAVTVLPIGIEDLIEVTRLPFHHRDPFDRLIIAQARIAQLAVVSGDSSLDAYGVVRVW